MHWKKTKRVLDPDGRLIRPFGIVLTTDDNKILSINFNTCDKWAPTHKWFVESIMKEIEELLQEEKSFEHWKKNDPQ